MNVIRFSDLVSQGRVRGRRVFIRADLNVPQDEAGRITEDTRIRASVPCIRMALDAGAAVMVTSHLGRPTEGAFKPEDSLAPVAQASAAKGASTPQTLTATCGTRNSRASSRVATSGRSRGSRVSSSSRVQR